MPPRVARALQLKALQESKLSQAKPSLSRNKINFYLEMWARLKVKLIICMLKQRRQTLLKSKTKMYTVKSQVTLPSLMTLKRITRI
jgi:hypothetical protein